MCPKKIRKALLFPHIAVMILLIPASVVFLVCSLIFADKESLVAVASYIVAFYTLVVWIVRIPYIIRAFKRFRQENKYALLWREDARVRINASLYGTLLWNTAYAVFQLALGVKHHTFWYYSLAGYYISLAVMRFVLLRYLRKNKPGENMRRELIRYRACGAAFLVMNMALSVIIFFMVYWNRTFLHHEITAIAMAAYTFTAFTVAIINTVKYRKYNSPVFSASKAISLAAACVSMLTLECTMLTAFDDGTIDPEKRSIFLALSGGAVSVFIVIMSVYMIAISNKKLNLLKKEKESL